MKKYLNEKEMLSAYLDGELLPDEKAFIEEKLAYSKELKDQLDELKKLKDLTQNSIPPLPQNSYFESRLMASLEEKKNHSFGYRKFIPVFSFVLLVFALMILLKAQPDFFTKIIERQKSKIASIYTTNLKPLLFASSLSNDEIFNFAMYKQIPLDNNNNQYLLLGTSPAGKEYFEVQTGNHSQGAMSLTKFISALKLNNLQKKVVDSILNSYSSKLQTEILINDKNSLAISPNLWNYNKAIAADLFRYAASINEAALNKILPVSINYYNNPQIVSAINKVKDQNNNEYIFFTPDSIFSSKIDKQQLIADIEKMNSDLKKGLQEANIILSKEVRINIDNAIKSLKKDKIWAHQYKVNFDSNQCKVEIPDIIFPNMEIPELDKLDVQLSEVFKNFKNFDIQIDKLDNNQFKMKYKMGDSSFEVNADIPNVDSVMKEVNKHNKQFKKIDKDSLRIVLKELQDSLKLNFNIPELKEQIRNFQKQMQKFQDDMQKFDKNEINRKKVKPKEPIEI